MDNRTAREFAFNFLLCGSVFVWLFSQTPAAQPQTLTAMTANAELSNNKQDRQIDRLLVTISPAAMRIRERLLDEHSMVLDVTGSNLKLRRKPILRSRLFRVYPRGTQFEELGRDGGWLNVRSLADGSAGWLPAETLQTVN